jgi:hypothetical protein
VRQLHLLYNMKKEDSVCRSNCSSRRNDRRCCIHVMTATSHFPQGACYGTLKTNDTDIALKSFYRILIIQRGMERRAFLCLLGLVRKRRVFPCPPPPRFTSLIIIISLQKIFIGAKLARLTRCLSGQYSSSPNIKCLKMFDCFLRVYLWQKDRQLKATPM